jgi:glycine/D-amino acid oxidase-like deaminating enzyme
VIGPDPRAPGLFWIAGLGGSGMGIGAAAGELLARSIDGEDRAIPEELSPVRLLTRARASAGSERAAEAERSSR